MTTVPVDPVVPVEPPVESPNLLCAFCDRHLATSSGVVDDKEEFTLHDNLNFVFRPEDEKCSQPLFALCDTCEQSWSVA